MDEFRVRNLSNVSLEAFDQAACWAYFLRLPRFDVRVSTFAIEGVRQALRWHQAIRNLPTNTLTILEGDVTTSDVIVWLAGMERRIDPECRYLKTPDPALEPKTFLTAYTLLQSRIPCTDRERRQGWNGRQALDLLTGETVIHGPCYLRELFFIPF